MSKRFLHCSYRWIGKTFWCMKYRYFWQPGWMDVRNEISQKIGMTIITIIAATISTNQLYITPTTAKIWSRFAKWTELVVPPINIATMRKASPSTPISRMIARSCATILPCKPAGCDFRMKTTRARAWAIRETNKKEWY